MRDTQRKAHILKSEKTLTIPRHIIFFDTETFQKRLDSQTVQQKLHLGWAVYYKRLHDRHLEVTDWFYYEDPIDFWDFVFKHTEYKTKLWVISRNLVFDFTVLKGWYYLKMMGYKLKFFYSQGSTSIISVYKKGHSVVFLDSMNWFVESIEKTGERIGLPKLEIDFNLCSELELKDYCRRDVEIELKNFKLFIKFLEEGSIARLCYTRGSTAMSAFLLRHYTTKIYIHNNKQALALEREAFKGGRVECYFLGNIIGEDFYLLDVNSLYPYVMRNNSYPVKYVKILHNVSISDLTNYINSYAIVARVTVDTDTPIYCVRRDRSIFPIGRFEVTLCTPELKYALAAGHIVSVNSLVLYKQESIFTSYVDKFYTLKQQFAAEHNDEYVELCKKMLNSLYGKFGQKAENWVKVGDAAGEPDRIELGLVYETGKLSKIQYLLGEIFVLNDYGESFDSFPAISAHVTAYGRLYLWDIMKQAGEDNYLYCDTDSLIVNKAGLFRLQNRISSTILGGIKIVEVGNDLIINGLKDYKFASKTVIKGIKKNAVQISDTSYTQEHWPSFKGTLRSGDANTYKVKTVIKSLNRKYLKGTVTASGKITPLVYNELYSVA